MDARAKTLIILDFRCSDTVPPHKEKIVGEIKYVAKSMNGLSTTTKVIGKEKYFGFFKMNNDLVKKYK